MPFTPFHMGPGAAIKAVCGRYFSLTAFGCAQILIDLEPLVRILRHDDVLHGLSHTYLGALFIGLLACLTGRTVGQKMSAPWNAAWRRPNLRWLQMDGNISWIAAGSGAWGGSLSHVWLDSMMHSDMQPFWPFSADNGFLYLIPAGWLYLLCVILGVFGFMVMLIANLWRR